MLTAEQYKEIAQKKFEELGPSVIITAYHAHITDFLAQLLKDVISTINPDVLSQETKDRIELLDQLLAVSSIDFANINSPLESYKIPGAVQLKNDSNILMREYITALIRAGYLK